MKNNNTKQLNFDISPILYSQVILNKGKSKILLDSFSQSIRN
ncbi:MAG: hypothetical protein BWX89_00896 [candidate division TA06 bacterium ADurb.Bin131]|uniref:Uncharacterized protein n=1 Tax=candidate division TA06 bacterium ADurb.Bin131 TaxID=1852827 RepID=A0A1V6C9J7_UNCT6|nr:MAG: hypothetical protein BWX89_00896 [candidate division TA06 bacterium ADurb.Bin131]